MANVVEWNDESFDTEVLESEQPVLVDFSAEWCGPCKILSPIIEELASEYADRLKVGKVDVDQAQQVAMRYGVMGVPTVMIFRQGEAVDRSVGAVPKAKIVEMIGKVLG
jgi:thioredoxin 1